MSSVLTPAQQEYVDRIKQLPISHVPLPPGRYFWNHESKTPRCRMFDATGSEVVERIISCDTETGEIICYADGDFRRIVQAHYPAPLQLFPILG